MALKASPEVVDQQKKDLTTSYQVMVSLGAWKHLEENILKRVEQQALKDEDLIPTAELEHASVIIAECRGRRRAIEKIRSDVLYIVNGWK